MHKWIKLNLRKLFIKYPFRKLVSSGELIDVVIPTVPKDIHILPLCIQGVRNCVDNVKNIYIVAPNNYALKKFAAQNDLVFVDEATVLDIVPKDINLIVKTPERVCDRSGWLFQQLLKLSGKIGSCDNCLFIDSDHVLLKHHVFLASDNKPVLYISDEYHEPYVQAIKKLTNIQQFFFMSYVAHKMIFNKKELYLLQKDIEYKSGKSWITAIIETYDREQISGFSEFELYGNFISQKHRRYWNSIVLHPQLVDDYPSLQKRLSQYMSVTFPEYLTRGF